MTIFLRRKYWHPFHNHLDEEVYYGLAVTLEVGESVDLPIYEEIKDRISIRIQDKEEIQ